MIRNISQYVFSYILAYVFLFIEETPRTVIKCLLTLIKLIGWLKNLAVVLHLSRFFTSLFGTNGHLSGFKNSDE